MKIILKGASCDMGDHTVVVRLSDGEIADILKAHDLLQAQSTDFMSVNLWIGFDVYEGWASEEEDERVDEIDDDLLGTTLRDEVPRCVVSREGRFYFTYHLRHCDGSEWETSSVAIDELQDAAK